MKYIYLFPDEPAMGHYQYECRRFGCEYLGKNRFQGERNLVIKGELSNLKRYAKWLDYELHPDYLYKENDFGGDIEDESCKDDEIEGIYECKNNEVIEVRYDDKYKNYRFTFQKGGSPVILPKEEGKKLLRQYQAVKYQDSVKDSKEYEYIDADKVNEAELKSLCRANHVELTKLSGEYRLYGDSDDIEYVLDSLGIELDDSSCKDDDIEGIYECKNNEVIEVRYDDKYKNYRFTFQKGGSPVILPKEEGKKLLRQYQAVKYQDSCKDSMYINGSLKEFNPKELVEKVKQRQENLHTNRIDKSGKVHTIFIDAHGLVENPSLLYVDVITQDIKGDNQERVLMKRCKDWEEAIQVMEDYKRKHMNDSVKDEEKKWYNIYNKNNEFINEFFGTEDEIKELMKKYTNCYYEIAKPIKRDACKDATMEQEEKLHSFLESQWTYLGNKGKEQVWQWTKPGYFPDKVRILRSLANDLISYVDMLEKIVYIKESSTYDACKDAKIYYVLNVNNRLLANDDTLLPEWSEFVQCFPTSEKAEQYAKNLGLVNYKVSKYDYYNRKIIDETPYQKQYHGLQKELKKMDSIHKAIKAYKKFKDAKELSSSNLDELNEQIKHYKKKHPEWKFSEIKKRNNQYYVEIQDSIVKDKSITKGNGEVHFFYERGFVKTYVWDRNKIHKDDNKWEELYNYAKSLNCNIKTDDYDYIVIETRQGNESNLCKVFNKINPNYSTSELMNLLKDSKKVKDAVSLRKGDWFIKNITIRQPGNIYRNIILYKVIDDKFQERNGFAPSLVAEEYILDTIDFVYGKQNLNLKKQGTTTLSQRDIENITVFNSVEEAFKWLKTRTASIKSISEKLKRN